MFRFQLTVSLGGVLLLGALTSAVAQGKYPAPASTPAAAGAQFYRFLEAGAAHNETGAPFNVVDTQMYLGALSRAQIESFSGPRSYEIGQLFALLARQKDEPQFEARVAGKQGDKTLVEVTLAPTKPRQVAVIAEDGGYRVDIKATYGLWNDLSGYDLDYAWAQLTGIVSPSLAASPTFRRARENARRASCQSNLKQQMLGVLQYTQDNDEKFPSARNWTDATFPYLKSDYVYRCPEFPEVKGKIAYGYAFNQYVSLKKQDEIADLTHVVAIYETSNPARNWFGPGTRRAYRHLGGSNIAFADGHVQWFAKGNEPNVKFKP